jgi:hypothetical protein
VAGRVGDHRRLADVEVRLAAVGDAVLADRHLRHDAILPRRAAVARDHGVMPDLALHVLRARVLEAALGEDDRAVGEHASVVGVVVTLRVAELLLRPGVAVVVRLADVEVAALGTVPRDVDVLADALGRDLGLSVHETLP